MSKMNERDIIIDPIITHNNHLIEVAPDEFVNVTQLWEQYKQIIKDKKDLQNRIDKALNFIDCHFKEMVADEEAQELKSILKESGE